MEDKGEDNVQGKQTKAALSCPLEQMVDQLEHGEATGLKTERRKAG